VDCSVVQGRAVGGGKSVLFGESDELFGLYRAQQCVERTHDPVGGRPFGPLLGQVQAEELFDAGFLTLGCIAFCDSRKLAVGGDFVDVE
jgi:hypothetical protein